MHAGTLSVKDLFGKDTRYVVPLFQRPYVWNVDDQWQPFWSDMRRLAEAGLDGRDSPPHFLGAIVLDQMPNPAGHLERRLVIDGQQRLTTIQLLLEAFADIAATREVERYDRALRKLTRNDDPISDDPDEELKVWPTNADQQHFRQVMRASGPAAVLDLYGKAAGSKWAGHPVADAYLYFYREIEEWLGDSPQASDRVKALYDAIRVQVRVVVIDLTPEDDAQVIFETLNARGTPLLPSDLVKNFLFHSLNQEDADVESLYEQYWKPFDDDAGYWRKQTGRGHARRPTIDTFLQHYLASQVREEVQVSHLFTSYRAYASSHPGVSEELENLHRMAITYRSFDERDPGTPEGVFFRRLREMNVTSAYPFLLRLFDLWGDDLPTIRKVLATVESFLVRRLITRLSTRGYARLFIELLQVLDDGPPVERVRQYFSVSTADFRRWPNDAEFARAWKSNPVYRTLAKGRVRMILEALEARIRTAKSEDLEFKEALTIEHLMPQKWREHYPIHPEATAEDVAARDDLKDTFGNLTLLTKSLNPSVSNGPWATKREQILSHSALALNRDLRNEAVWTEDVINKRSGQLFDAALANWPGPGSGIARSEQPDNRSSRHDQRRIRVGQPSTSRGSEATTGTAVEKFRGRLLEMLADAHVRGDGMIQVRAGDLHKLVGGYPGPNHRMPSCCSAMRSVMEGEDRIVQQPPKGNGASLTIEYRLPRKDERGEESRSS